MTYKQSINTQNFQLANFDADNRFDIPPIEPITEAEDIKFLGFNYALTEKNPEDKTLHFYLDDYQFERLWNRPQQYLGVVQRFKYVLSPDFSMFTDYPMALNIYNHFRKHWLAAYWQSHGVKVIPTICWSTPDSFEWCFDGEPVNSIVSVSSVGANYSRESRKAFLEGYEAMEQKLQPTKVIFYGKPFEELKDRKNIIYIENEQVARLRKIEVKKEII